MKKNREKLELSTIARLHYETLPTSLPTLLGLSFVNKVYSYFKLSKEEHLLSISENNKCFGFSIYSANPTTLSKRLFSNTPIISSCIRTLLSQSMLKSYQSLKFFLFNEPNNMPELLYLCVNQKYRGLGLGSKLVKDTINYSLSRNDQFLSVRCQDHLVEFYTNLGFKLSGKKKYNILIIEHASNKSSQG